MVSKKLGKKEKLDARTNKPFEHDERDGVGENLRKEYNVLGAKTFKRC